MNWGSRVDIALREGIGRTAAWSALGRTFPLTAKSRKAKRQNI